MSVQRFLSMTDHFSAAKFLFAPGAIFLAIIAASIAIVPVPHIGSSKTSSAFHFDKYTSAAARVSLIGAIIFKALYPLFVKDSPELSSIIMNISL